MAMTKKIKIILAASLILNVVFIGFAAGHKFRHGDHKHGRAAIYAHKLGEIVADSDLPEAQKDEFIDRLKALHLKNSKGRFGYRQTWRDDMQAVLEAPIFDAQAFRALLENRFQFFTEKQSETINVMVDIVSALSPQDRAEIAEELSGRHRR